MLGNAGASVYNVTIEVEHVLPLGIYSTVFQAEVSAILACVKSLQTQQEVSIAKCSDSQAAQKALQSAKTTSSLVAETITALKELSLFNSVRLIWVPGHSDMAGNETAD